MGWVFYLSKSKPVIQAFIGHSLEILSGEGTQFFLSGLELKKKSAALQIWLLVSRIKQSQPPPHSSNTFFFCFISSELEE